MCVCECGQSLRVLPVEAYVLDFQRLRPAPRWTARSWVGDPVGRIICCNLQLCDLTAAQQRAGRVGEATDGLDSWRANRGEETDGVELVEIWASVL